MIEMQPHQAQAFAMGVTALLAPLADGDKERPTPITAKEFGLFCLGLMLLKSFAPTQMILGDQIDAALAKAGQGGFNPVDSDGSDG